MMRINRVLLLLFLSTFPSIVLAMDGERQGSINTNMPPAVIAAGDGIDDIDSAILSALTNKSSGTVNDDILSGQVLLADVAGEELAPAPPAEPSSLADAEDGHQSLLIRDAVVEEQALPARLVIIDKGRGYYLDDINERRSAKESAHVPSVSYPSRTANAPQKTNFQERFPGRLPARRGSLDPMERREARREFFRNNARRVTNRPPGVVRPRASGIVLGRAIK